MNNPRFQLFKSPKNNQYYFRLRAGNGEIILGSEGYYGEQSCRDGIASVKKNAPYDERYLEREDNGSYSFVLKAENGRTIGRSESYTTAAARDNGIEAVKRNAPNALTEDLT